MTILDHVKNIQIDLNNPPINNFHALDYLATGLYDLASIVKNREKEIAQTIEGRSVLSIGPTSNDDIIICHFHWFCISAVNYVRLIGLFDIMQKSGWKADNIKENKDTIKNHCKKYVIDVIPNLYQWRNKIAAHFAATDPFDDDNIGTLKLSLMNPVSFSTPHFEVGAFQWSSQGETSEMPKWSLVETYEEILVPRYWPNVRI